MATDGSTLFDTNERGNGNGVLCLQGKRVMVIDEDAHLSRFIYETLTWHGASLQIANSGSQAYELLRNKTYDLVICARLFPGLTGQNLYRLLESWMPSMNNRFLFITNEAVTARTWQFFSNAGVQFLRKPYRFQDLVAVIESMFSRSQPQNS
jgi:DNA-binding response OmpR family regulator